MNYFNFNITDKYFQLNSNIILYKIILNSGFNELISIKNIYICKLDNNILVPIKTIYNGMNFKYVTTFNNYIYFETNNCNDRNDRNDRNFSGIIYFSTNEYRKRKYNTDSESTQTSQTAQTICKNKCSYICALHDNDVNICNIYQCCGIINNITLNANDDKNQKDLNQYSYLN